MATATVTIPTIQAYAATTLETRIAAIKKFFGLPRWVTRNQPAAQSAIQSLPTNPAKFLQPQTVESERERNLIALMEVSKLSKGRKPTVKDRIFMIVDSSGSLRAEEIAEFLPTSPYKTVTSRISEMVKEGTLVVFGKCRNDAGIEVSVYALPKEGK